MAKHLILFFCCLIFYRVNAQQIKYEYDKSERLVQVNYPDQKKINYQYDKDGNRISQMVSTIITNVGNLNDSLIQANNGVFIYPNPSNGDFISRIYSSQKQEITLQIFTSDGKLVHTYSIHVVKGYYDLNVNISPKPSGSYIVTVKGKTINSSKKVIISN